MLHPQPHLASGARPEELPEAGGLRKAALRLVVLRERRAELLENIGGIMHTLLNDPREQWGLGRVGLLNVCWTRPLPDPAAPLADDGALPAAAAAVGEGPQAAVGIRAVLI